MKKNSSHRETTEVRLGDLICALYEEAEKLTSNTLEQRFMVYAALKDLLGKQSPRIVTKAA